MHSPESVVETSDNTAVSRVCCLDNVQGSCSSEDGYTKTEQQTTTHELANSAATRLRGRLNDNTCTGNSTTDHHPVPATPGITSRTDEGKSGNTTDLIHGSNDASPGTSALDLVVLLEGVVREKRVEHRSIETVASGAEEADDGTNVQHNRMGGEKCDRFLELGLCEGFGTRDDLDFSNSALEVLHGCQHCEMRSVSKYARHSLSWSGGCSWWSPWCQPLLR